MGCDEDTRARQPLHAREGATTRVVAAEALAAYRLPLALRVPKCPKVLQEFSKSSPTPLEEPDAASDPPADGGARAPLDHAKRYERGRRGVGSKRMETLGFRV
jgi:hypothetical protein